jgi:spermidine synthase
MPGGGELRLKQRGAEFSIMLGSNELMNSRLSGSEEALARLACEKIRGRRQPQMLIGGLGMGFTLRAALAEMRAGRWRTYSAAASTTGASASAKPMSAR